MKQLLVSAGLLVLALLLSPLAQAEYPKPSLYPIAWELKFEHASPKRVVVEIPGNPVPQAYWYMTYTVTNNTNKEQMFLPDFELMTKTGKVIRSDIGIPLRVFDAIKAREKKQFLEPYPQIADEIRLGEDQARDGVAIWPEPMPDMGQFTIFVGGLSGEIAEMKDSSGKPMMTSDNKPVILRKTLELNYKIRGDNVFPGEDPVNEVSHDWVMR